MSAQRYIKESVFTALQDLRLTVQTNKHTAVKHSGQVSKTVIFVVVVYLFVVLGQCFWVKYSFILFVILDDGRKCWQRKIRERIQVEAVAEIRNYVSLSYAFGQYVKKRMTQLKEISKSLEKIE